MDGLIPFLFHAIKKQKGGSRRNYRSLSDQGGSTRSYHLLIGNSGSLEGSSHRRTRSEFQPPTFDFIDQHSSGIELHSRSLKVVDSPRNVKDTKQQQIAAGSSSYQKKPVINTNNVSRFR
ncbi:hypothetical protein FRX31_028286 [Thalictrum thalictroides]|uniref:Uncharacterized protein n=1 Tax=Thalictrum thalictroides TaxID=46969 RepID=A0A7J6VD28_THATH|nr:hypothetical protein FRX31_028286 [Thalictrum thalictroides]